MRASLLKHAKGASDEEAASGESSPTWEGRRRSDSVSSLDGSTSKGASSPDLP